MQIYGYPGTRSLRALWAAEEVGAAYEFTVVDLTRGEHRQAEFLSLNPAGKVPVLVEGDLVLSESAAICTYLGDRYPDAGLLPGRGAQAPMRAQCHQWCCFVIGELEQPLWTLAKHTYVLPQPQRVSAVRDTARWEFGLAAQALARALADREYMVGDRFTVADLLIANTLSWARRAHLALNDDRLERYADRLLSRPALARAREREQAAVNR